MPRTGHCCLWSWKRTAKKSSFWTNCSSVKCWKRWSYTASTVALFSLCLTEATGWRIITLFAWVAFRCCPKLSYTCQILVICLVETYQRVKMSWWWKAKPDFWSLAMLPAFRRFWWYAGLAMSLLAKPGKPCTSHWPWRRCCPTLFFLLRCWGGKGLQGPYLYRSDWVILIAFYYVSLFASHCFLKSLS